MVSADVPHADVIAHDDDDVGLLGLLRYSRQARCCQQDSRGQRSRNQLPDCHGSTSLRFKVLRLLIGTRWTVFHQQHLSPCRRAYRSDKYRRPPHLTMQFRQNRCPRTPMASFHLQRRTRNKRVPNLHRQPRSILVTFNFGCGKRCLVLRFQRCAASAIFRYGSFGKNALSALPAALLLLGASLLMALETPSKPFLTKNSFYLSSAGFKVHFANDAEAKRALQALPPHRFVIHHLAGGDVRYLYAEPQHCVCVFIGTKDAYISYRAILQQPLEQADNVAPDYKSQVSAVLMGDPVDIVGHPPYAAEYFANYY